MKPTRVARAAGVSSLVLATAAYAQPRTDAGGPIALAAARHGAELAASSPFTLNHSRRQRGVATDWSQARRALFADDDVRVALDDGTSVRGRFVASDDQGITLAIGGIDQQLSRARIARLSVTYKTRRRRHESIGMAVGAVLGAWIWNRQCGRPVDNCQEDSMLYFAGPMLAGGLIGHALPAEPIWRDLYVRR